MNICFFHAGFSNTGGIERVVSILLNKLCEDKSFRVFSLGYIKVQGKNVFNIDSSVHDDYLFEQPLSMTNALLKQGIIKKVKRYIKDNNIDIIIACGALYFPIAVIAARLSGAKSICWEHTNPSVVTDYKFQKQCRLFGIKHSSANVVITASALGFYEKIRKKGNSLIYNPVDDALFECAPTYDIHSKRIISVGRLCYAKNYKLLIDIAERVLTLNSEWSWDIFGMGEDYDALKKKIDGTGVSGRLILKGNVTDIYQRYQDYSFIAMTSRYEGFPMVLLEASAKALPMVAFDIETGPNEIISDNQNGRLVLNYESADMVDAINELIADPAERMKMSANAYKTAKDFSIDKISEQWKRLFEVLNG